MAKISLFRTVVGIVFTLALTIQSSHAGESRNCNAEFRRCSGAGGMCVWVGIPSDSNCGKECQIRVMRKIQDRFPVGVLSSVTTKEPKGCVGFRPDLDGTEEGAMCLANLLGYRFDPVGCSAAGYPYNVVTE